MKTIFSYVCFYNHLPNTTFRYSRHFAKHKYSQKIRTQSQDVFGVGNLIATHTFIGKEYRHVSANCSQVISTQWISQLRSRHFIQRSHVQNVAVYIGVHRLALHFRLPNQKTLINHAKICWQVLHFRSIIRMVEDGRFLNKHMFDDYLTIVWFGSLLTPARHVRFSAKKSNDRGKILEAIIG